MTPARRMAVQYVLIFLGTGVSLPFGALWLAAQGMDGARIAAVLAAPMLGRVVTGPLLAVWSDGFRLRRTPMMLMGAASALGYAGAAVVDGFWAQLICWFVGATAASTLVPLTDVLTLRLGERHGFPFAIVRAAGSAAFVVANIGMGLWLLRAPIGSVVIWISLVGAGLALCAGVLLPQEPVRDGEAVRGRERFRGLGRLVADPVFMAAILAVGLVQAAHAFHYAFSAILWKAQGISEFTMGLLWAFGVLVEIAFMAWLEPWRRRLGIGPWALLMAGAGGAVVRWGAMALTPPLWLLWPLQALHALTFAASFLAGIQIVERLATRDSQTAAQTLSSTLSAGLLIGLATSASGWLYQRFGFGGYAAMAAMGAAALVLGLVLRRRLQQPPQPVPEAWTTPPA